MKYIAGPWKYVAHDTLQGGTIIAPSQTGDNLSEIVAHLLYPNAEANARLIAAAPNLLDAAKIARNVLSDLYEGTLRVQNAGHELQAIVSHIEAAIDKATRAKNKATGETQ